MGLSHFILSFPYICIFRTFQKDVFYDSVLHFYPANYPEALQIKTNLSASNAFVNLSVEYKNTRMRNGVCEYQWDISVMPV